MNHMRQGQNSKRSRGRGGRKPQSSGNRAYDSNGPDVKIRGTAAHVCEKYQQLARDAISAGDRVMAENYYQHAEHYYRLLMASQVVNEGQPRPQNALGYRPDEDQEEEEDDFGVDQPQPNFPNQPFHQQQQSYAPRNNGGQNGRGYDNNPNRQDRQQGQDRNPAPAQVAGEATDGAEQNAGGEPRGEFPGNGGAPGPDGQRRPGRGRRRRQRHDGGVNAGGEARGEGGQPSEGGGEAAPSGGNDEAPAA
ncbi:MAG: DUF4167 domain-containing protein [Parvibaculum sp.]|uniref:DUF4167 domain-containing protein n=1 Tax=Parvibaculum sp. TaxID=2024848 RepID=UPI002849ACA2|nr:DUF4167 domain-containing protein [Parvibaculum sp.]MDR3497715.1 DUF4167 domain-containing protein [Parvibaculum sp.]